MAHGDSSIIVMHGARALANQLSDLVPPLAALSRHFIARDEGRWAAYCLASFVAMLLIFFSSFTFSTNAALFVDVSLVVGWMGLSVIAFKLLREMNAGQSYRSI